MPFGHRRSLFGHPIPAEEFRPPHGRPTGPKAGPRRGYRVPHTRAATGLDALYTPGTTVLTRTDRPDRTASAAFSAARPYTQLQRSTSAGFCFTRHQRGFKQFIRPVFPSPAAPGWNGRRFGFPPSFEPRRPGVGRRTSGWGQAIEHEPETTLTTSAEPPIQRVHSWVCDLASHGRKQAPPPTREPTTAVSDV